MTSTPRLPNGFHRAAVTNGIARRGTSMTRDGSVGSALGLVATNEDEEREDDPIHQALHARWEESEQLLAKLFTSDGHIQSIVNGTADNHASPAIDASVSNGKPVETAPVKKTARIIDDDYGDDEDEDEEENEAEDAEDLEKQSPLKSKGKAGMPNGLSPLAVRSPTHPSKNGTPKANASAPVPTSAPTDQAKSTEEARKQTEDDKKAAAESAKRNFQMAFYTFENDRDAMLEQQKLDDLDREVENEISGDAEDANNQANAARPVQGSLGSADLGASSLTLKHLIARIDAKRDLVRASDNQLRTLISEVRKGRSKWASEDRVGQEELYEAAEKVLLELRAMTDYVQPFLQRVSKREAPDYFNVIRQPMDIGTMLKKLKSLTYKSKKEFVDDLNLIWANCLKYNSSAEHPFRKKALYMRKETDKLIPLIPEIVVRDRAEVEAEERRLQTGDVDDSDDDDAPIMASRGRKAPKKGGKGTSSSGRKALGGEGDDKTTPAPDARATPALPASAANHRHDNIKGDTEMDGSTLGFSTPPPAGTMTPGAVNGIAGSVAQGSQADVMEVDGPGTIHEDLDEEDAEFKTWKQITMKDRALAASERNRLFRGDHLNVDEPALLRNKAGMRRWMRQQKLLSLEKTTHDDDEVEDAAETATQGQTLAEGIEKDEDSTLPDYYNPLSHIPSLEGKWKWMTDSEGFVIPQNEEYMRMLPRDRFKTTPSQLVSKIESNMRQMQDTRKVCAKIGIVKQMQIQAQTYQNQFQKYDPEPFLEAEVDHLVTTEDGPIMAPWLCRAAFQRSVGKIFYHAGFEDFQPSALETVTDLAQEYFVKLVDSMKMYHEQARETNGQSKFTFEEQVLHTLHENGTDLESLETYVKDDVERLGGKLGVVHERMKAHLADLLRPALGDHAGADGVGAFNDGSEQFVGGDFAEDLDEDFFGFRELGLADEFGLESMSVPLHLLQNRLHSSFQTQSQGVSTSSGMVFEPPENYEPITQDNVGEQIGIVQDYFRSKLRANHHEPLIEDEDLPQKQKFPKPRLPPTGKILSPRKRPLKEQQQAAKKKRKLDEDARLAADKPIPQPRFDIPDVSKDVWNSGGDPEKDISQADQAMMSPESLTAN